MKYIKGGFNLKDGVALKNKEQFEIIPIFNDNGEDVENVIINAFLKYLKYNDYK